MAEILQWPVNPERWVSEWESLGGGWVNDGERFMVINPRIYPSLGLEPERERRMLLLARQYNNPAGRKIIQAHIAGLAQ